MKAKLVQVAGTALLAVMMSLTAQAKLSAKSYIANGLIGHWDGIENVSYGAAHDGAATRWNELTGKIGGYFNIGSTAGWSFQNEKGLDATRTSFVSYSAIPAIYNDAYTNSHYTVEIAYTMPSSPTAVVKMLGLGTQLYYAGLSTGRRVGISGPGIKGTTQWPGFYVTPDNVVGSHTFSGSLDATSAFVDFDGVLTATKSDVVPNSGVDTRFALKLGGDFNEASGLDGTYHVIRFYDHALTADEVAVNRAVDQIRFFGKTVNEVVLPADCGYRFTTVGNEVFLEKRAGTVVADDAAGGTFSLNGEAAATTADLWVDTETGSNTLTLVATPASGYAFIRWEGGEMEDADRKNPSATVSVGQEDNIVARFRKIGRTLTAKDYVTDGLIGHWDGVENVAYGQLHDGDATKWNELTGQIGGWFGIADAGWSFSDTGLVSLPGTTYCVYSTQSPAAYRAAFTNARYTVEISYTASDEQSRIKFLGLGYADHYVGYASDSGRGLGFSGPGFSGTRLFPIFTVMPDGISGSHTFSCRQDGSRADIDIDGVLSGVKEDIVPVSNVDTRWALQLGCDYTATRNNQNNVYPLNGTYHAIRFYSRALTPDEVSVNRAVDQVRYLGIDPLDATLPDGWRFNTTEGVVLERKFAVASSDVAMGLVSVGDGEPAASADCWVEKAVPTPVKLTAVPAKDYKFVRWEGAIAGDDLKAATGMFVVSGNVTAVFKEISGLMLLVQ